MQIVRFKGHYCFVEQLIYLYNCVCTRQSINQIVKLFSWFYANLATRVIIKQRAQFDSSEYYLKEHTQPRYEINTILNQKNGKVCV